MVILLAYALFAGLITILAPCIWPLLPIILSSSSTEGKAKPLGITLGIITSFAFFTLSLSYIIKIIPFDPNILRLFAVIVIGFFGLTLIIPALNRKVEGFVSGLSGKAGSIHKTQGNGFLSGLTIGISLGIVWSPCAGPILATIATLSAAQAVNAAVVLVTIVYVIGVGIPLFAFATAGNRILYGSKRLNKYTGRIQQVFGMIMILTALAIFTNFDKTLEVKLLDYVPSYSNFVTSFESNPMVMKRLDSLKENKSFSVKNRENKPMPAIGGSALPNLGSAPDFIGITHWLNTDKPLMMKDLRGKVVLVDFWTYTCINCIRTLPHVTAWYDKYHNKGFVVIGVHTPEFEFEKKTSNVQDAIKQYGIHYPVAQDNSYSTWNNYNNQYWPAEYLIDVNGNIRHEHFGEGEYGQTEQYIQNLLEEAGKTISDSVGTIPDQTPSGFISPETYVGSNRMDRFASNEQPEAGQRTYTAAGSIPLNDFAFTGTWDVRPEYAKASKSSTLRFHFSARHVYLVMSPQKAGDKVKVFLDDKPIISEQSGKDVINDEVTLDMQRLYDLVDLRGKQEEHTLMLRFENDGDECFAFTFG